MSHDTTSHQTNIDSAIHQDAVETIPSGAAALANGNGKSSGRVLVTNGNGRGKSARPSAAPGLKIERRYTRAGEDVYATCEWELRDAVISNERGEKVFEQKGVEIPKLWTQLATNVVVSKYFRGHLGSADREHSVRQLIGRVARTMAGWGRAMDYFASEEDAQAFEDELTHILLFQKAAFNSPVWFNVGLPAQPAPQCSACQPYHARVLTEQGLLPIGQIVENKQIGLQVFDGEGLSSIVAVKHNGRKPVFHIELEDGFSVEATADHLVCAHQERRVRPLEWKRVDELIVGMKMRVYPHAARTHVPNTNSVEISEAALAGWLQADGFVGQYTLGTNRSLTLEFMTNGEEEHQWIQSHLSVVFPQVHYKVRDVVTQNTTTRVQRIRLYGEALRPFVEKYDLLQRTTAIRVPSAIDTASEEAAIAYLTSVFQSEGYITIQGNSARIGMAVIAEDWTRDIQALLTRFGIYSRRIRKSEKREDRYDLYAVEISLLSERAKFAKCIGFLSETKTVKLLQSLGMKGKHCPDIRYSAIRSITELGERDVYDIQTSSGKYLSEGILVHNCFINSVDDTMESILTLAKTEGMLFKYGSGTGTNLSPVRSSREPLQGGGTASGPVSFMRGFDMFAAAIKSGGKTRRAAKMVMLDVDHPDIMDFIESKAKEEKKAHALIDAGYSGMFNVPGGAYDSVAFQNANHSVRVSDEFMRALEQNIAWHTRFVLDSQKIADTYPAREVMRTIADSAWLCGDPGLQYDTTINKWHTCKSTDKINASNPCSEYMFLDDSACNLSSLNLMKFRREDGEFDAESFKHASRIMITAQEIIIDNASYPTPRIQENSHDYRPLGLGYANLGALLMSRGVPYDSDRGRAYAGAITALMTGEAYKQSAIIARDHGWPFPGYQKNREPFLEVMRLHRASIEEIDPQQAPAEMLQAATQSWNEAIDLGEQYGYRNAQATVLAPTGCLVGDSLVLTGRGLVRLRSLGNPNGEQWQTLDTEVATDDGPRQATQFYVNGVEPVVTVETGRGYRIQGTPAHRIKVVNPAGDWEWKRFADIRPGDRVPLLRGGLVGSPNGTPLPPLPEAYWTSDYTAIVPREMNADLAEFVGYFMGDGSLHSKGIRLCVAEADLDVTARLTALGKSLFGLEASISPQQGYTEVAFNSVRLTLWWEACGFVKLSPTREHTGKGYAAHIPDAVLHANDPQVYAAFIRGLFEADGTATNGYVSWTTTTERFSRDVQSLLLALGFVTTRKIETDVIGRWGKNAQYVLRLLNASTACRFGQEIGFISKRKQELSLAGDHPQAARYDHIPVSREMVDALAPVNDSLRKTLLMSLARTGTVSRRSAEELLSRANHPKLGYLLSFFYDEVETAELGEEQSTYDLSVPQNVTYVANGFVSHNTIGFLMDCDTTGIEPDIAIVKYKNLVGGGVMKIVNNTVPEALAQLGYDAAKVEEIIAYIDTHDTIEGAPGLKPEHLPVFDCAFKPGNGIRSIHYMGHVRMMAAAQPFISGAISKTVNMPHEATAEEIMGVYVEGWKLGLKAIAIYRDGSKRTQPLMTKKADDPKEEPKAEAAASETQIKTVIVNKPLRRKLPDERNAITHKFSISGHEGYITVGMYPDGQPGEIFLTMSKEGSTISGLMDSFATAISLALQYGVPLQTLVDKFAYTRYEPSGYTNNPEIRIAKSISDYIFRYLGTKFLSRVPTPEQPTLSNGPAEENGLESSMPSEAGPMLTLTDTSTDTLTRHEHETFQNQADAPICTECGSLMVRNGACFKCLNCGSVFGCS